MANQWVEIFEHAARDTVVGDETFFPLPVMGSLKPKFSATDEPRKEFAGPDSGLGATSFVRRTSQQTYELKFAWRPIAATGLLFKHGLGKANARTTVDTTGREGIIYMIKAPYGAGQALGDSALGFRINYDDGAGATKSRIFYGFRITEAALSDENGDFVWTVTLTAPGEFIQSEAAATSLYDFSALPTPFSVHDVTLYIGAGVSRTGTGPDFTAIGAGTMDAFQPDSFSLNIKNGRADAEIRNGIKGPSKTKFSEELSVSLSVTMDYEDPASGFSSKDEAERVLAGVATNSILVVIDNGVLAGATTETYKAVIDLPFLKLATQGEESNAEGKTAPITLDYVSGNSTTTNYPLAIFTTDQVDTYNP